MTVVNKADELTVVDKVVKFIEDRHRANTINMKSDPRDKKVKSIKLIIVK